MLHLSQIMLYLISMRQTNKKHRMTSKEAISFALFVLLRRKNFNDITIGDIVERANVSRMTFYRYFKNKEDVFVYFTDERFEEFMNTLSCTKFSVNTFTHTLLRFVDKHKPSIELLIKCGCENLLLKQFDNYIAYIFRSAISKNSIYINNKYYQLIGKACMNYCFVMIDSNVGLGDVVHFISKYNNMNNYTSFFGKINHEVYLNFLSKKY